MSIRNRPAEALYIHGRLCVRLWGMPVGEWLRYDHPAESLIAHVGRELGVTRAEILAAEVTGIDPTTYSRCGKGMPVPDSWISHLSQFSGIPPEELRVVGAMPAPVARHPAARVGRKPTGVPPLPPVPRRKN